MGGHELAICPESPYFHLVLGNQLLRVVFVESSP